MGRPDAEDIPDDELLTSPELLEHAAGTMQLLADRTRLGILAHLSAAGELSVGELAERLSRPVPAVSQHLAKLKGGDLVTARRDGTSIRYRLGGQHVAVLLENLLQHTEHALFADPPHHAAEATRAHEPRPQRMTATPV